MPDQRVHPPSDQLTAFALGRLEPKQIDEVGRHVADCAECRANVKSVPQDTFVTLIRDCETVPNANRIPAPTPEQTIDLPAGSGVSAGSLPATPADLPTLAPALSAPSSTGTGSSAQTLQIDPNLVDHPRYQILGQLGQGGMGAVYQAEHRMMQRTVALKVINQQYVSNQTAVDRFRREVQAAARLQHPNIVTAYDAEQAGDTHFLVMEYVPGKDLEAVVKRKGPLPIPTACHFIRQAALGLQHAHEQGMVHRDIKPQNLMLNAKGQIKILDFGLASLAGDDSPHTALTQQGSIMGTPDYMAPEQANDASSADIRADIYSLGCTLYRLLTGQVPFPDGKAMDKILAHLSKRPRPIQELRPEVPELLARIVQKMMAKDPAKRFQTPAEVARILTQFVTKTTPAPAQSQPNTQVEPRKPATAQSRRTATAQKTAPVQPPRRRWPLVAALAGAAAVLLMVVAAIVIYLQGPDGSTIRIEINDPGIKVGFAGKSYTFDDNGKTIKVTPGDNKKLYIEYDNLKFWTDDFSLGEDRNLRLRVEVKGGNLKVMVGDEMVAQHPVPPPAVATEGGWALEFDGVDDYVKLPPFLKEPKTRELTVEAWFSITDFTTSHQIQNLISGKWDSFVLGIQKQGPSWLCRVNKENFGPSKKVPAKQLLHVALVMKPAEAQFYVDGRLVDIKKLTAPLDPATPILYLGCWAGDQTSCLKGKLYAVRFSQSSRYNGNFTPERRWKTDRETLALYRFDEGQGDTLRDSSGNGYDGAIHGAKWMRVDSAVPKSEGAKDEITLARKFEPGHTSFINSVAVTPDGNYAVSGAIRQKFVILWNIDTGKIAHQFPVRNAVRTVAVSSDGRYAAAADYGRFWIYDLAMRKTLHQIDAHDNAGIRALAFSPDSKYFLTAAVDRKAILWDLETGKEVAHIDLPSSPAAAAFTPDGHALLAGKGIEEWDWRAKKQTSIPLEVDVYSVAASPDGQYALAGYYPGNTDLIDLKLNKVVRSYVSPSTTMVVHFLPDGKHFLTGSNDGTVRLWSTGTGTLVASRKSDSNLFCALAVTSEGKSFVAGGGFVSFGDARNEPQGTGDYDLRLWQLPESVWPKASLPPGSVAAILISDEYEWTEPVNLDPQVNSKEGDGSPWVSADGLTLLFASNRPGGKGDYDIWQCTRQSAAENWSKPINLGEAINSLGFEGSMTFSADRRTLVFAGARPGGQGKMDLWMATRESADAPWQAAVNLGATTNSPENDSLPFLSKEGLQLIFASNRGGRFQLFITTRKSVNEGWSNPEPFSKAGHRGGRVQLLDSGTTLLYTPNSLDIYFAIWNATEKRWANDTRLPAPINDSHRNAQFCFCPSTNTLYFESDRPGGQGETDLWMARRVKKQTVKAKDEITLVRKFESGHPSYISSIAVSPNGKEVLSGSLWNAQDSVLLWDLATGKLKHRFAGVETSIGGVAISGDGKYAAAGGNSTLYIWDLPGRKMLHHIPAHDGLFFGVAISPDNRQVLTAGRDKTACLWDIETGKEVIRFTLPFSCQAVAFTPDGKKAVIGGEGCQLWDLTNGKLIQDYPNKGFVRTLALSADGELLATGGPRRLIWVWNLAKNQYVNEFSAQTQQLVCAVQFLPDRRHVLGGCSDGTLRIWSLKTGLQVAQASSEKLTFNIFALTPDGKQVVAGGGYSSGDGEWKGTSDYDLRLWQLPESVWPKTASQTTKK